MVQGTIKLLPNTSPVPIIIIVLISLLFQISASSSSILNSDDEQNERSLIMRSLIKRSLIHDNNCHNNDDQNERSIIKRSLIHDNNCNNNDEDSSSSSLKKKGGRSMTLGTKKDKTDAASTKPTPIQKPDDYEGIVARAMQADNPKETHEERLPPSFFKSGRGGTSDKSLRWKNYKMIILIDKRFPDEKRRTIESAIWTLNDAMKCFEFQIGFIPPPDYHGQGPTEEDDHLFIEYGPATGCSSALGKQGGRQTTTLTNSCEKLYGITMHEILHVLGFYHEHTRPDRNSYLNINWAHPRFKDPSYKFQFDIRPDQKVFYKEYDFDSIMHYPLRDVMTPKVEVPAGVVIGQRNHLSEGDLYRINAMYPCSDAPRSRD